MVGDADPICSTVFILTSKETMSVITMKKSDTIRILLSIPLYTVDISNMENYTAGRATWNPTYIFGRQEDRKRVRNETEEEEEK
jgi:hypothetical protein